MGYSQVKAGIKAYQIMKAKHWSCRYLSKINCGKRIISSWNSRCRTISGTDRVVKTEIRALALRSQGRWASAALTSSNMMTEVWRRRKLEVSDSSLHKLGEARMVRPGGSHWKKRFSQAAIGEQSGAARGTRRTQLHFLTSSSGKRKVASTVLWETG